MLGLSKMSGATTEQQQRTTNKDVVHTTTGGSTNYSSSIKYHLGIFKNDATDTCYHNAVSETMDWMEKLVDHPAKNSI